MANLLTLKIDVRKLDKARFFEGKPDASGHRPLYADIVLIPRRELGKYGDTHVVKQSKKREETVEMPILGSATERGDGQQAQQAAPKPPATPPPDNSADEDVPF